MSHQAIKPGRSVPAVDAEKSTGPDQGLNSRLPDSSDLDINFSSDRLAEIRKEYLPVLPSLNDLSSYATKLAEYGSSILPSFLGGSSPPTNIPSNQSAKQPPAAESGVGPNSEGSTELLEQKSLASQVWESLSSPLAAISAAVSNIGNLISGESSEINPVEIDRWLDIYEKNRAQLEGSRQNLKASDEVVLRNLETADRMMRSVRELLDEMEKDTQEKLRALESSPELSSSQDHLHETRCLLAERCDRLRAARVRCEEENCELKCRLDSSDISAVEQAELIQSSNSFTTGIIEQQIVDHEQTFGDLIECLQAVPGVESLIDSLCEIHHVTMRVVGEISAEIGAIYDAWHSAALNGWKSGEKVNNYLPPDAPKYGAREGSPGRGLFDGPPGSSFYSSLGTGNIWDSETDLDPRQQFSERNIPEGFQISFATELSSPVIEGPIHKSAVDREKQKDKERSEVEVERLNKRGEQAELGLDGTLSRHDSLRANVSDFVAQAAIKPASQRRS